MVGGLEIRAAAPTFSHLTTKRSFFLSCIKVDVSSEGQRSGGSHGSAKKAKGGEDPAYEITTTGLVPLMSKAV